MSGNWGAQMIATVGGLESRLGKSAPFALQWGMQANGSEIVNVQ
jgi:hypothetical protein